MEEDEKPTEDQNKPVDETKTGEKPVEVVAVVPTVEKSKFDEVQAELDRLKADAQTRADAELSEKDREKKRADDAEAREKAKDETVRRLSILQSVRDAASAQKIDLDLDAVRDLYDAGKFRDVKVDDRGDAIGVPDFLKTLVKDKPYILRPGTVKAPDINADKTGTAKTGEMDAERRAQLEKRFRLKK